MPYGPGCPLRDRIEVEFVVADVEIGFNLVDLAEHESKSGDLSILARVLHNVDDVLHDIDRRLSRLGEADKASFEPLVAELRREVQLAKARTSSPGI